MKISFDINESLYKKTKSGGKDNGRSVSAEIRFQLTKCYEESK